MEERGGIGRKRGGARARRSCSTEKTIRLCGREKGRVSRRKGRWMDKTSVNAPRPDRIAALLFA